MAFIQAVLQERYFIGTWVKERMRNMAILKREIMKIWKPGLILAVLIMSVLWGYLFLAFPLQYFPNGPTMEALYDQMMELTKKYGVALEEEEWQQEMKNMDVHDGDKDALASILDVYENRYQVYEGRMSEYTKKQQARLQELIEGKGLDGMMAYEALENAQEYWRWAAILLLIGVVILTAPMITRERLTGVETLQFSSKRGRRIVVNQYMAVMLSAIFFIAVGITVLYGLYAKNGVGFFWNNPINSFYYSEIYWYDMTYGQYVLCLLTIIICYIIGMVGITFALSCHSKNYISLMLKLVPVLILVCVLMFCTITWLFSFHNMLNRLTQIKGIEVICSVAVLFIGVVSGVVCLRQRASYK